MIKLKKPIDLNNTIISIRADPDKLVGCYLRTSSTIYKVIDYNWETTKFTLHRIENTGIKEVISPYSLVMLNIDTHLDSPKFGLVIEINKKIFKYIV